jgi:BirA family biotin operon repressor/biotin-[acetyl-CoA-carboxylase] ligase
MNDCDSTNMVAKKLLSNSEPIDGTVIIADYQTSGKGQIGNTWQSNPYENLTFSIILKPHFLRPDQQFLLSKMISLACVDALNSITKKKFTIKWPNDIYFKKQKIAGILIENTLTSNKIWNTVVGIGLNVNQTFFSLLPQAVSLKNITNSDYVLKAVLDIVLKKIDAYYLQLRSLKIDAINENYTKNMLGLYKWRTFVTNHVKFKGKILGVNPLGQLIVEKQNSEIVIFNFKEIAWKF